MSRLFILAVSIFISLGPVFGQFQQSNEVYKIGFESAQKLPAYDTGDETVIGFDNGMYAVDMEIVPIAEEAPSIVKNPKLGAKDVAEYMGITQVENGEFLPKIPHAYFVSGRDYEYSDGHPVIVMIIVREEMEIVYEVTIDCYNGNLEEGKQIARSFFLIE